MPELPEVEVTARNLRTWMVGRRVTSAWCNPRAKRMFRPATPASVARAIGSMRVVEVDRRGKQLLITLHDAKRAKTGVLAHLGMTGKWIVRDANDVDAVTHAHVRLVLDDRRVVIYRDPRMFGRVRIVPDARFDDVGEIAALGPDPLGDGITVDHLAEGFARTSRPVKVVLLDQSLIAGIGNIQASEALFRAHIDPKRSARSLDRTAIRTLRDGMMASLRATIEHERAPEITYVEEAGAPNPFRVYGKAGERCPHCRRGTIERFVQAQRATFWCARCQR